MTEQQDLFPRNREKLLTTTKATATATTHPTMEAAGAGFGFGKRIGTGSGSGTGGPPAEYRKRDRVRSSAPRSSRTSANARDAEYQVRLRRTGPSASPAQRPPVAATRSTARQNTRASTLFCLVRTRGVIKIKLSFPESQHSSACNLKEREKRTEIGGLPLTIFYWCPIPNALLDGTRSRSLSRCLSCSALNQIEHLL